MDNPIVFLFLSGCSLTLAAKWSYKGSNGPLNWHELFPDACSGLHQSPIDIQAEATMYDPSLRDFAIWYDPPKPSSKMTLMNNGHTVKVGLEGEFSVSNGGLLNVYKAVQFHFHWGHKSHTGSEHKMEGKRSPIEMHLVTFNEEKYKTLGNALTEKDGLAVLGVMFEVSEEDNPAFEHIVEGLKYVKNPGETVHELPLMSLRNLLPNDLSRYFRYNGSLTTPGCYESVIWTVFDDKQKISHHQLHQFRKLLTTKRQHNNHKNHGAGSRHRRESEAAIEEAVEAVKTELGVAGDKFEESMLKDQLLEKKQLEAEKQSAMDKHHSEHSSEAPSTPPSSAQVQYVQDNLVNNFRPVQPLNGRLVYRSFKLGQPQVQVVMSGGEGQAPVYTAGSHGNQDNNGQVKQGASLLLLFISACLCLIIKI